MRATKDLFDPIQRALSATYGEGKWLLATAGSSPYLNYDLIDSLKLDATVVRRTAAAAAMNVPHVARVYTRDQLQRGVLTEAIRPRERRESRSLRASP